MIVELCVFLMLGMNAWIDHKKREISLWSLFIFTGIALFLWIKGEMEYGIWQHLGMMPGLILLLTAIGSRGKIGIGDGLIVLELGIYLSLEEVLWIVCASLLSAALYSLLLCWKKGEGADLRIPYVPFLFGAYVVYIGGIGL